MSKFIKIASALLISACSSSVAFAKVVDENTAKAVGSNFLISTYPNGAVKSSADLSTTYTATCQANGSVITDYYVFNINGGTGFVMVSADDNIIPILAYSCESSFDINNISPSAKNWIDGYKYDITTAILNKVPAQEGTRDKWNELSQLSLKKDAAERKTASSFPSSSFWLLGTMVWNQSAPSGNFNADCPNGDPTGCVATAMAQVMKFWNWPTVGSGSHTYTQYPNPMPTISAQTADFGNTAYAWSLMSNTASNSSVALLMYHCGVSLDMDYSPTESGTYVIELESTYKTNNAEFALKTFFHYKRSTLRGVPRGGESGAWPNDPTVGAMTDPAWITMLKAELDANRPVIYSGNSTTAGGHCWVADGYDASSKMHFNFGWNGASDGYYTINSINPAALGIGGGGGNFNNDQCAIIGIQPDSFATLTGNIEMNSHLDCKTNSPTPYTPSFTATATIMNAGSSSFSGDFCAQVYDTNFVLVGTVQTITGQTIAAGASSAVLSFAPSSSPLYQMVPGPYNIRIMYRPTGTTTWTPVANNGNFYNENLIQVANSTYDFSTAHGYNGIELAAPIVISGGGTVLTKGKPVSFTASVKNQTGGVFNGSIQAALTNVTTGVSTVIQLFTGQSIFYSGTNPYTFAGTVPTTIPSGTYTLSVQHQTGGTGSFSYTGSDFYENPMVVTVAGSAGINTPSAGDKINVYPNPSSNIVYIAMNGVAVSRIRITDIQGHEVQNLYPGNQTEVALPVNNFAAGIYFVNLYTGEEVVTKKIVVTK